MSSSTRKSEVFTLADQVVERTCELSPITATEFGVSGHDRELDDFSPASRANRLSLYDESLAALKRMSPKDGDDLVAQSVMRERLEASRELDLGGELDRTIGVISSPALAIREVFELMASSTPSDARTLAARLRAVEHSLATWRETLDALEGEGVALARRQVVAVADQLREIAGGGLLRMASRLAASCGVDEHDSGLRDGALAATKAFGETSQWLETVCAPRSVENSYVGRDRYETWCRYALGTEVNLVETYEWGWAEMVRINERMWQLAHVLTPGAATLREVADRLDSDPRLTVRGVDAIIERLRTFVEGAVERLDGREFTIDPRIRHCDVREAPEGTAAAPYYRPPSEDLSRPGTTWFPTRGREEFAWWTLPSIWYHEAVPGHHLQLGSIVINSSRLSRFQRLMGFTSAWAEGWALYAERLAAELGFFEEPALEMGYLMSQSLRAARVVVDIGAHLQLRAPRDFGELEGLGDVSRRRWDPEMMTETLVQRALVSRDMAQSEVERYLSLPAQAISYKVGERAWLAVRDAERSRQGESFSLRDFHDRALALGPVSLADLAPLLASR